jgi:hypothetical protein
MGYELLFIIKKKFYNRRVIRNIYEYINEDTRTMWLKKYRDVINNGRCPVTSRFFFVSPGVCSGLRWLSGGRPDRGDSPERSNALQNERHWRLERLANVRELKYITYITPLTMNIMTHASAWKCMPYKFTTKRLFDCCIENKTPGIVHLPRGRYLRETLLKALMSI